MPCQEQISAIAIDSALVDRDEAEPRAGAHMSTCAHDQTISAVAVPVFQLTAEGTRSGLDGVKSNDRVPKSYYFEAGQKNSYFHVLVEFIFTMPWNSGRILPRDAW
jgi:hypothetical protein